MFERFTERARQVIVLAQDEAETLRHGYVGTEHILLGLLRVEDGLAARVLAALDITAGEVRSQIVRVVGVGDTVVADHQIAFTPRSKKVLDLALREALALGDDELRTEHILLGVVREDEGVAARILLSFDADAEKIRRHVMESLPRSAGPVPLASMRCPACGAVIERVDRAVDGDGIAVEARGERSCAGCGTTWELNYYISWRASGSEPA